MAAQEFWSFGTSDSEENEIGEDTLSLAVPVFTSKSLCLGNLHNKPSISSYLPINRGSCHQQTKKVNTSTLNNMISTETTKISDLGIAQQFNLRANKASFKEYMAPRPPIFEEDNIETAPTSRGGTPAIRVNGVAVSKCNR